MVCKFARVTRFALAYEFGGVSFLKKLNLTFLSSIFSHIVKKIVLDKSYIIKLYKVHELIHKFSWLIWFAGLTNLTFFN